MRYFVQISKQFYDEVLPYLTNGKRDARAHEHIYKGDKVWISLHRNNYIMALKCRKELNVTPEELMREGLSMRKKKEVH